MQSADEFISLNNSDNNTFKINFSSSEVFVVSPKITHFSKLLASLKQDEDQIYLTSKNIDIDSFRLIIQLLEAHNYDERLFLSRKPILSRSPKVNLSDNIDKISFDIMKDIVKDDQKMMKLLHACEYLDMDVIKNLLYCCWASQQLYAFPMVQCQKVFGAKYPNKRQIKQEYKSVFEMISNQAFEKLKNPSKWNKQLSPGAARTRNE